MPQTDRMRWAYPAEDDDPWFDQYLNSLQAMDASGYAAREDRNLTLAGGGTFTFVAATGVIAWSAALEIISPTTAVLLTLPPGSTTLVEGRFGWVTVPRAPTQGSSLAVQTGPAVPSDDGALLLFVRRANRVYVRGAKVLNDGDAVELFQVGGGLPLLPSARVWVGDGANSPVARVISGDVTIDDLGAVTIANDAVTPAKVLKSGTFDFATALGTVRVQDPTANTDAANRQWVLAPAAALTVRVAQGHVRAQDSPRTGIPLGSETVPFATLGAAFAAIALASAYNVSVQVWDGYYDENVDVPDGVTVQGMSDRVYITRLRFNGGGENSLANVRMFNSAAFGSVAPNLAPLEVRGGTQVRMVNVRCEDYDTNVISKADAALRIIGGAVSAYGCQFGHYNLPGGVGGGGTVQAGVELDGAGATFIAENCSIFCATDTSNDIAAALAVATDSATGLTRLTGCHLLAALLHASATGRTYVISVTTSTAPSPVEMLGGSVGFQAPLTASPAQQLLLRIVAVGIAQVVTLANVLVRSNLVAPTGNRFTALPAQPNNVARLFNMIWAYATTPYPMATPANGLACHTGVLADGSPYPLALRAEKLAGAHETDGSLGIEVGSGEITAILPSAYGEHPTRTFVFTCVAYTTNPALAMTVRLVNVGTGAVVAALSTTSTTPVKLASAPLTVGTGLTDLQTAETLYEVRYELDLGLVTDKGRLCGAQLEVT